MSELTNLQDIATRLALADLASNPTYAGQPDYAGTVASRALRVAGEILKASTVNTGASCAEAADLYGALQEYEVIPKRSWNDLNDAEQNVWRQIASNQRRRAALRGEQ